MTLTTGVMMLKIQLFHHNIYIYIYTLLQEKAVILNGSNISQYLSRYVGAGRREVL